MNLNKVIIVGRLTQDPELRTTPSGTSVCSFGVATNRVWTNRNSGEQERSTEFHNVVAWRRLAEITSRYLQKGNLVLVEGRLQTRSWEDPSGTRRQRTEIVADNVQLPPKNMGDSEGRARPTRKPEKKTKKRGEEDIPVIEEEELDDEEEIDVEDIPF